MNATPNMAQVLVFTDEATALFFVGHAASNCCARYFSNLRACLSRRLYLSFKRLLGTGSVVLLSKVPNSALAATALISAHKTVLLLIAPLFL